MSHSSPIRGSESGVGVVNSVLDSRSSSGLSAAVTMPAEEGVDGPVMQAPMSLIPHPRPHPRRARDRHRLVVATWWAAGCSPHPYTASSARVRRWADTAAVARSDRTAAAAPAARSAAATPCSAARRGRSDAGLPRAAAHTGPTVGIGSGGGGAGCAAAGPPGAAALPASAPPTRTTRLTASITSARPRVRPGNHRRQRRRTCRPRSPAGQVVLASRSCAGGESISRCSPAVATVGAAVVGVWACRVRTVGAVEPGRRERLVCLDEAAIAGAMTQAPTMPLSTVTTRGASAARP